MAIMDNKYYSIDEKMSKNGGPTHLREIIENEMDACSIETYAYLRISKNSHSVNLISTYPKQWLDIYLKNKYYNFDPVVKKAKYKIAPFLWNKEENESNNIFEESRKYAISYGACFIAHGNDDVFSVFSICDKYDSRDFFRKLREKEAKIQMILLKCFEEDIAAEEEANCNITLTPREQEVLRWLGLGKTYNETSLICGISERTVRFHLINILKKLNANNTKYALTKAALYGLLDK